MPKASRNAAISGTREAVSFNYNKLQAVACIASSAAVSIGAIYWLVRTLF